MGDKPKRKNSGLSRNRWILIGVAAMVVLFMLILVGLVVWAGMQFSNTTVYSGEKVVYWSRVVLNTNLPRSALDISIAHTSWLDSITTIRFGVEPVDGQTWVAEDLHCFNNLTETSIGKLHQSYLYPQRLLPSSTGAFLSGQCGNNPYYRILIDQSDSERWIIYIEAFSS